MFSKFVSKITNKKLDGLEKRKMMKAVQTKVRPAAWLRFKGYLVTLDLARSMGHAQTLFMTVIAAFVK